MANRITQQVAEALLQPTTAQVRVTQHVVELVMSSVATSGPGNGDASLLWLPSLEQYTIPHSGARNLLISLNKNQTIPNDGAWKESRVLSSLVPCTTPNYIAYGGYIRWEATAAFPFGVGAIQRVGLCFWGADFTFLSEAVTDSYTWTATGGLWVRIKPAVVPVPTNAAYVSFQCSAFVSNNPVTGGPFNTLNNLYADFRWDDLFMVQQTDPTNAIQPKGSLPPNWTTPFAYTSTSTSITWTWAGTSIFRSDGTTQPIPAGSIAVTGLTASTTYYFFPYWDEDSQSLGWVLGTHGNAPNNVAFLTSELDLSQNQQQNLLTRVALSQTAMQAATTSGGTGGGYGGGSGRCNRIGTKVRTKTRGVQRLEDCFIGEEIKGRKGWTTITHLQIMQALHFIRFELESGDAIEVTPTHPFTIPSDQGDIERRAMEFSMSDMLYTVTGVAFPKVIKVIDLQPGDDRAECVTVTCSPEAEFYAGEEEPNILSHNLIMVT